LIRITKAIVFACRHIQFVRLARVYLLSSSQILLHRTTKIDFACFFVELVRQSQLFFFSPSTRLDLVFVLSALFTPINSDRKSCDTFFLAILVAFVLTFGFVL
jgi:hypothetical protein